MSYPVPSYTKVVKQPQSRENVRRQSYDGIELELDGAS